MHQFMRFAVTLTAVLAVLPMVGTAQEYPSKPIRLVTMFAPGSNADTNARFSGAMLGEQLGVPFVIESKAGAGGLIALREVHRAQPVGYSILLANTAFVGNTVAYKEPLYRIADYTVIGVLGQTFHALIMHNSIPANSLAEFVGWARANPGKLNYASLGPAAGATLSAERFNQMAGIDMVGVPFKGGDPAAMALLAGQIHVYFPTLNTARNRMKNPQIKGLAMTGPERSSILPNVPTFKELGYPNLDITFWTALFAPATTPALMLGKLRGAFVKASGTPEWKATMQKADLEPFKGTPEEFMDRLHKEAGQLAEDFKRLKLPQG